MPAKTTETVTLSREQFDAMADMMQVVVAMAEASKHQAKKSPSASGLYPATVLMTADGKLACDQSGAPIVSFPPVTVAKVDAAGVHFTHPNQHVSPKHLAALADVHIATVWRDVKDGALPKPAQISSRRVGFSLQQVQEWLGARKAG
jgi:predicted DNA-binding transcriptional regulator AlpA